MSQLRTLAFYLPQFHPIAENDAWWGTGFTEWTNVSRGKPLFSGHYQPQLPSDLGFYDLRVPEVRERQAALAVEHGISGFVYYHYWFNGKRLLERPFQEVLDSQRPDFPFALCWANENWTRIWDGGSSEILMAQAHSREDDLAHIRWLSEAFLDSRYIRVDGKPLFLVYRASELGDPRRTTDLWRSEARRLGIGELYLCKVESFWSERQTLPADSGFDAAVEWIPDWAVLGDPLRRSLPWRALRKVGLTNSAYKEQMIFDYDAVVDQMIRERTEPTDYVRHPCVTVAWDNSTRRARNAIIFKDATPATYGRWLAAAVERSYAATREPLVFINAWNEWAEGSHLEPDQKWGRAYLETTRDVLSRAEPAARSALDIT